MSKVTGESLNGKSTKLRAINRYQGRKVVNCSQRTVWSQDMVKRSPRWLIQRNGYDVVYLMMCTAFSSDMALKFQPDLMASLLLADICLTHRDRAEPPDEFL